MVVIFTSRNEGKALLPTRRILDLFAERIGNDTWQTVITQDGLNTVKALLKKSATRTTAVACYKLRHGHMDLEWIVGNKTKYAENGTVPVFTTKRNVLHEEWQGGWEYLPVLKILVALAALFHDWGKANARFQNKLARAVKGKNDLTMDPFRHEWISVKLLQALIAITDSWANDENWLFALANGTFSCADLENELKHISLGEPVKNLPPIAQMICCLIMSHHKLPVLPKEQVKRFTTADENNRKTTIKEITDMIPAVCGYENTKDEITKKAREECVSFPEGLLYGTAPVWTKQIKRWAAKAVEQRAKIEELVQTNSKAIRLLMLNARLCLMLADHYISSLDFDKKENAKYTTVNLQANTNKPNGKEIGRGFRQTLEEHLCRVAKQALLIAHELPRYEHEMERAENVKSLRRKSPSAYAWQDKAVNKIKETLAPERETKSETETAWFAVNMASTGCGKTYANAKIMWAISPDGNSLRYILAVGLRSLTMQTGMEYKEKIGLDKDDMAVLIGSSAVKELQGEYDTDFESSDGAESAEEILREDVKYEDSIPDDSKKYLDIFFKNNPQAAKNVAFLYKPVLVTTIDHLMGATETRKGGRYILPLLRLMSSDLVIDEIDDFNVKDLVAIARLVQLAGMLGRCVLISSATIPPDLAEGMYKSYVAGLRCRNAFMPVRRVKPRVLLCDEFNSSVFAGSTDEQTETSAFEQNYDRFVAKRCKALEAQPVKRIAKIVDCSNCLAENGDNEATRIERYFSIIKDEAEALHSKNFIVDKFTGKKISFGLIRVANIDPCVALTKYLANTEWSEGVTARVMAYHSRQLLLMRHVQEKYLDSVMKRKGEKFGEPVEITELTLRNHIDHAKEDNILFIVVATPVEEIGRDHDFDWAMAEPSSFRSIIQLAGRVKRHRELPNNQSVEYPNISILQYNLRGIRGKRKAFIRPGFEENYILATHDVAQLLPAAPFAVNAEPRLKKTQPLHYETSLIDLEHQVMQDFNDADGYGPGEVRGWSEETWYLTAFPQILCPFRQTTRKSTLLCCVWTKDGDYFADKENLDASVELDNNIRRDKTELHNLWLERSYEEALSARVESIMEVPPEDEMCKLSKRYGEIELPDDNRPWIYSEQLGIYRTLEGEGF